MCSAITHQNPDDARAIFRMLWQSVKAGGQLYFTAFIDDTIKTFAEGDPAKPSAWCSYNPDYLIGLAKDCGWIVKKIYAASELQQPGLACDRV